jgi:hypothetical protein
LCALRHHGQVGYCTPVSGPPRRSDIIHD